MMRHNLEHSNVGVQNKKVTHFLLAAVHTEAIRSSFRVSK